jgi:hypothetical protein
LLAILLVASVAQAQSVPPAHQASDSWSQPAPATTVGYRDARPKTTDTSKSHFKFKERGSYTPPAANAAQQHSGNAAVGAMGADSNGRPAVNCPQTPMDPACH